MEKILAFIKKCFSAELQRIRRIDYIFYYLFYSLTRKVKPGQILMLSESRAELSGNLKFIDDKIDKTKFQVLYSMKSSIITKRNRREKQMLCQQLATSEYILVDDFIPVMYPLPIRKESRFIQVWHAVGAFKTVGFSRLGKPGGPSPRSLSHRNYTDTIVSSETVRKNYAEAFGISMEKVHATGIPRTDIFFDEQYSKDICTNIYARYPQLKGKKVILFAPTFRGNGVRTAHYNYSWISFPKLKEELGEEYMCIIKMHPFIHNKPYEKLDSDFFLDLSEEREINDLLFVTDILITDYSSVIFEAALRDIKTVFFVPDYDEYVASRDFYYPFEEYTYGPVTRTEEEVIQAIKNGKKDENKLALFKEKFCANCDGKSTERFIKYFLEKNTL